MAGSPWTDTSPPRSVSGLWREEYCARCVNIGQRVRLERGGQVCDAAAEGIDPQYGLTVRYGDGTSETLRGGEVSVRGLYGYSE